jgi:simple sugar transport system ATP-binding protein
VKLDFILDIHNITKAFPRTLANDDVSMRVRRGEIHALVGENGAGKTTLMNILYGLIRPDSGSILLRGAGLPLAEGYLGADHGIGMIHQHFMLISEFTVLENIILGAEPGKGLMLDRAVARRRVEDLLERYGIEADLDRRVRDLSVGEEQRVEILKVLYRDAELIVMDEPTGVLTPQETNGLFETMRGLVADGKTVVFITHKLEEVLEVTDTVTVMRRGRVVGSVPTRETDAARLAEMMVGKQVHALPRRAAASFGEPVLTVSGLSLEARAGVRPLREVSFEVRAGEVLGICGVEGNGQLELFEAIIGLRRPSAGSVTLGGRVITHLSTLSRREAGLADIPPDRTRMGIITEFNLRENLLLGRQRESRFSRGGFLDFDAIGAETARLIDEFGIRPPDPEARGFSFSGGNQQKIVVARELARDPEILVACQPTRGVDIGATRLIHTCILKQADAGKAVLLVSADLSEILALSDRIGVMYRGRIVGVSDRADATEENLGLMMAGVVS